MITQEDIISLVKDEIEAISKVVGEVEAAITISSQKPSINGFNIAITIRHVTKPGTYNPSIAVFQMTQFPGNCGTLISHDTIVYDSFRNKGISQILQKMKQKIARMTGYTIMMATTTPKQDVENHILEKTGWIRTGSTFENKRTYNKVSFWCKPVETPAPKEEALIGRTNESI